MAIVADEDPANLQLDVLKRARRDNRSVSVHRIGGFARDERQVPVNALWMDRPKLNCSRSWWTAEGRRPASDEGCGLRRQTRRRRPDVTDGRCRFGPRAKREMVAPSRRREGACDCPLARLFADDGDDGKGSLARGVRERPPVGRPVRAAQAGAGLLSLAARRRDRAPDPRGTRAHQLGRDAAAVPPTTPITTVLPAGRVLWRSARSPVAQWPGTENLGSSKPSMCSSAPGSDHS
jgi:hypothetical protein